MKKLFAILAIAVVMGACNNKSEEKTVTTDSLKSAESPLMDAVNTADSANKLIDSMHNHPMPDTANKK